MRERMWHLLQAVFPREEHMLATKKKCGRRGPILVLDSDFGGAAHGTVRWIMKEGASFEVMHVPRSSRAIAAPKKKTKKTTQTQEKLRETSFIPTSETPKKLLRRCLARFIIVGHTQKTRNTSAAKTAKLKLACPKTLSKVHAVGGRDLCAPQHQKEKQTTTQHGVHATRKCRPRKHMCVTGYATLSNVEGKPWRATHDANKTTTAPSPK